MRRPLILVALVLSSFGPEARAARPMITDDARVVDPKACQVEAWARKNEDSREFWALPACNPWGNAELTFGGARTRADGEGHLTDVQAQAKTILKPLEANGWGAGIAVGTVRHPRLEGSRDWYAYAPFSYSTFDDRVVWHLNLGWLREQESGKDRATWGFATESQLSERAYLIAETFGRSEGRKPFYQAGLRLWVVPNRMQVDATVGDRFGGGTGDRWFSIGMRLLTPAFLP